MEENGVQQQQKVVLQVDPIGDPDAVLHELLKLDDVLDTVQDVVGAVIGLDALDYSPNEKAADSYWRMSQALGFARDLVYQYTQALKEQLWGEDGNKGSCGTCEHWDRQTKTCTGDCWANGQAVEPWMTICDKYQKETGEVHWLK